MSGFEGTLHYFAYGSNINLPHLRMYLALHGVDNDDHVATFRPAMLHDHRLRTNYHTCDGSGACNIEACRGYHVEGLVMRISAQVQDVLRRKEGWPVCYEEIAIQVMTDAGRITAMAYVVTPDRQLLHDTPVSPQYRELILEGAREAGFSSEYQRHLRHVLRPLQVAEGNRIFSPR